jgi:hypothetical protein
MVYTHKNPALLIMGLMMLAIGASVSLGWQAGIIDYLKISKLTWEMTSLTYIFGGIAVVVGLWHLLGKHEEGHLDYYLSTVAGVTFILLIAMFVRWYLDPYIAVLSKSLGPVMGDKYLHDVLGLNYVVLGILAGIIVVNVFRVPRWAENGVRLSRLGLKTGVVLLGTLYSAAELQSLGGLSIIMIGIFVLGSVGLTLWLGARRNIPNSMGGVLSAGMGVCGVSAAVASAPVVQAKSVEIAYTIGTILLWGVGCMFLFPVVGTSSMGYVQLAPGQAPVSSTPGGRCGPRLSAQRHRDPEGSGDLQHHPRAVPAHHRGVAGGLVCEAGGERPGRQRGPGDIREVPGLRDRLPAHVWPLLHRHLRPGAALPGQVF